MSEKWALYKDEKRVSAWFKHRENLVARAASVGAACPECFRWSGEFVPGPGYSIRKVTSDE